MRTDHTLSCPNFLSDPHEAEVARILSMAQMRQRLDDGIGPILCVARLSRGTFKVTGSKGDFVVRFPSDEALLSMLKKEESVQRGLRDRIDFVIPNTKVIDDVEGSPVFAIHTMIPGQPLTTDGYNHASHEARDRLVRDLVKFFHRTHTIPLGVACEWLGIVFNGEGTTAKLASAWGKPTWFGPDDVAEMRPDLEPLLDSHQTALFEDTVRRFAALGTDPSYMVFGHGDMHGYNMAIGQDPVGLEFIGAFDLGCTGILDIHEDFFRLSLISEDLLDNVIETYENLPGQTRSLQRDRIAIYYRAFLFYLMVGKSGESLEHLKTLLHRHLDYYASIHL